MKLSKSRYYLVHLGTQEVNTEIDFARVWQALDWADRHGFRNVTAMSGAEIERYPNVWKVPLTAAGRAAAEGEEA